MNYNAKLSTDLIRVVPFFKSEWRFEFPRLDDRSDDMLDHAIDHYESGNFQNAESDFRLLIEGFPEFLDAYHHLAMLLDEMKRHKEAKELWRTAADIGKNAFPKSFRKGRHKLPWGIIENRQFLRVCHAWGLSLLEYDDTILALKTFKDILSLNPNDNQGIRALAIGCCFHLSRPKEVLSICKRFPDDTMEEVLYGRPLALFQLGEKEEARIALRKAIEWSPRIAKELNKKTHRAPANLNSEYTTVGGADEAFLYWKYHGQYWKNTDGALDFLLSLETL